MVSLMNRDVAKLQGIARDLSELGLALSNRSTPPDAAMGVAVGEAFVALSEAIGAISAALEQGAASVSQARQASDGEGRPPALADPSR